MFSVLFIDTCENGWRSYGNHCYLFEFNKINWHDAKVPKIAIRSSYQEGRVGILLISFTPTHCFACPKTGP
jgi:hypothetical protein